MNILFTICARAGSKGVKNKNVRLFCGSPLIYYTIAAYETYRMQYEAQNHICLALNTDSELLVGQMEETGIAYLPVKRKESLAGDTVTKKDVIADTLKETELLTGKLYDIIVDLDLTSPLRTERDIDGTIRTLLKDMNADIAYSVTEARRSPYFNMVAQDGSGYYKTVNSSDFVARQQAPVCYDMNASIYAYRRSYLLSDRLYDRRSLIWIMRDTGVLDIDSEKDLELMEVVAEYLFANTEEYAKILKWIKEHDNENR